MMRYVLLAFLLSGVSSAAAGDLVATYPFRGDHFELDAAGNRMYVTRSDLDSVAVIDTRTLALIAEVPAGDKPAGLALSLDGETLFVAARNSQALVRIDTETFVQGEWIDLPHPPYDVVAGLDGRLYVSPGAFGKAPIPYNDLLSVDSVTGDVIESFSFGVFAYYNGLLAISPDRENLFFVNRGLSPGTLAHFDVSTAAAALVWKNDHGALGSNGQDLGLSPDGQYVSYACGGGNHNYDIICIRTSDHQEVADYDTGPYPREVVYAPNGNVVAAVHMGGHVDFFERATSVHLMAMSTQAEPLEMAFDSTGRLLFAAMDNALHVYETPLASATFRNDLESANPAGYSAAAPGLGGVWTATVDNTGTGNFIAGVMAYSDPLELYLPRADGHLLIDPTSPDGELLQLPPAYGYGVVSFSAEIPEDVALIGFALSTQGAGLGGGGGTNLHNAFDLIAGY